MTTPDSSFEDFVIVRSRELLRLGYLVSGDAELTRDLLQNVLIRLAPRWRRVAAMEQPDAYVRRMLVREFLGWRRRAMNSEVPTAEVPEQSRPDVADDVTGRDSAWRLLATLPPRQRAVLVLRFYEDLTDAEIARVLGCRQSTVRSQAARALATLRAGTDAEMHPIPLERRRT